MDIKTRALPLLAISDHVSRNSAFRIGALVGFLFANSVTVADAFDVKHDSEKIDESFFHKKLALLRTTAPTMELLGWYSIDESAVWIEKFRRQMLSLGSSSPSPLFYFVPASELPFECFCLETAGKLSFSLVPGESEVTAVSTVQNHAHYSRKEADLTEEIDSNIGLSLRQLQEHVSMILASNSLDADTEKLVVHLAQLVSNHQGDQNGPEQESLHLHTAQLSLLASQIATTNCANAQLNTQAGVIDRKRWTLRGKKHT